MKKTAKGYPYRESKKPKTKLPEDRRPHLGRWLYPRRGTPRNEWLPDKPEETPEERRVHRPDIRHYDRTEWSLQEAYTLIDMWAEVSWGRGSKFHKEMARRARYFRRLWNKQKGRCAVTGIDLYGAPGCGGRGIGIDIINYKFGIRKGNIRLVSAPIAYTRHKCKSVRHGIIEPMNPVIYESWPVFWAVIKHFQWYMQKRNCFDEIPVIIKFPIPTLENQSGVPESWIRFEWQCYQPGNETWADTSVDTTEFAKVYFFDDKIGITYLREHHPRQRGWAPTFDLGRDYDHVIQLCDPHIDFNKEIVRWAKKGFEGFGRWLGEIGKDW